MKLSVCAVLAVASTGLAQSQKLFSGISPCDFGDGVCVLGSTCAECFGEGNIICDKIGCFNPDDSEQCCKDAVICVGRTDTCCEDYGGTGVVGTSGAPVSATVTESPSASGWTCTKEDSGEGCCQKGGADIHWCSGEWLQARCYNSKLQSCCTDGTVCDERNCCQDLFSLSTTQPWVAHATTEAPDATTAGEAQPTTSTDGGSLMATKIEITGLLGLILAVAAI